MPNSQLNAEGWSGRSVLRRLIPLAAAMLAAAALLGSGASSASAAPVGLFVAGEKSEEVAKQPRFEAEKYTATINGTGSAGTVLTVQWGKFECTNTGFFGSIASASNALTLAPGWLGCTFHGFFPSIATHGCEYVWRVGNSGPPYAGSVDIKCPGGQGIEFVTSRCTVTILPQTGLESISYANAGTGTGRTIEATFNLSGIKYTQLQGTGLGKCTTGEFANGTYVGSATLAASK